MLIHTDPFIPDEDGDYAMDGAEIYYAVFNDTHLTLNISVKDTDEDGIEDGPEVYAFFYAYAVNYAEGNRSYWADPMKDDAYNDSDSDGLANIEEWERSGYRMDYDRDEIPNFYDTDDDNDKLPTSVELSAELNPFNSADAHGDKDSDGLDNLWEYENGTVILYTMDLGE